MPIETYAPSRKRYIAQHRVAFTPKGGCPLKPGGFKEYLERDARAVAFTPKGGCLLKLDLAHLSGDFTPVCAVAFTPKGGCPLKLNCRIENDLSSIVRSSIHPQGWVPIETKVQRSETGYRRSVAFTPKGGCVADEWLWRCTAQAQCV